MADNRELTSVEEKWVRSLKNCLKKMPSSLELNVGHGQIAVCNKGAMDNAVAIDSSDHLVAIEYIRTKHINPDSESL